MKRVGIIGLGNVGEYYVKRFMEARYSLTVFDIDKKKKDIAIRQGAIPAISAADVTKNSDYIILSLPKSEIVEAVMEDKDGVLSILKSDQIVIDTSTSRPKTAMRLETLCEEKGAYFLDSPLTWRGPGHTHILMVGGKEEGFKKAEEILKVMSYKYRLFGPVGTGQTIKLINQSILANEMAIYAEAVELTKKCGINSAVLKEYLGFKIDDELITKNYKGCGELGFIYKDLGYLLETAHDYSANIPISSMVHEILKFSKDCGEADWRLSGIQTYYSRLNND